MKTTRNHKPDLCLIFGVAIFAIFGLPSLALAWGPSVHLWIGDTLIQTVGAALPLAGALLRRHARSFLYGCLSPDFYVGKGSAYHDDHCHNWSVGKRLLATAESESERAFAYGYMAHLAADVIGHNYFVPNNLYRSAGISKLGHVYFELHADNLLDHAYVDLADSLVSGSQRENDALLNLVIMRGLLPFEAKKRIFSSWISISNHSRMKGLLMKVRPYSETLLANDDVRNMMDLSLGLAFEMLRDPTVPVIGKYDPIGAGNIKLARDLRKESKRAKSFKRSDVPFPIPAELRAYQKNLVALSLPEGAACYGSPTVAIAAHAEAVAAE
jgi:hypothetical protein